MVKQFNNENSIQTKGIISFINTIRPRDRIIVLIPGSVSN